MLTADEGRSKLRKASGRRKRSLIRGYPNGATRLEEFRHSCKGGEPGEVKHLSSPRRRNRRDSLSSGERKGISLNLLDVRLRSLFSGGCGSYFAQAAVCAGSQKRTF